MITIRGIPLTQDGRTLSKAVRMAEAYAKTVCRDLDAVMNSSDEEIADKLYSAGTEEVCSHDIEAIRDDAIAAVSDALDYLTRAKRVLMVIDHIGDPRAQPVLQSKIVMPSVATGKSSCRATRPVVPARQPANPRLAIPATPTQSHDDVYQNPASLA